MLPLSKTKIPIQAMTVIMMVAMIIYKVTQNPKISKRRTTMLQDIDEDNILDTRLRSKSQSAVTAMAMSMMSIDDEHIRRLSIHAMVKSG